MIIQVRLFARARDLAGRDILSVELPAGATAAELRRRVAEACPALRDFLPRCAVALGGDFAADDQTVPASCEAAIIPPVSGGQPPQDAPMEEPAQPAAGTAPAEATTPPPESPANEAPAPPDEESDRRHRRVRVKVRQRIKRPKKQPFRPFIRFARDYWQTVMLAVVFVVSVWLIWLALGYIIPAMHSKPKG